MHKAHRIIMEAFPQTQENIITANEANPLIAEANEHELGALVLNEASAIPVLPVTKLDKVSKSMSMSKLAIERMETIHQDIMRLFSDMGWKPNKIIRLAKILQRDYEDVVRMVITFVYIVCLLCKFIYLFVCLFV
jgi:hypothetical protein